MRVIDGRKWYPPVDGGRVIDGPWEGRHYKTREGMGMFRVPLIEPLYAYDWRDDYNHLMQPVIINEGIYVWSRTLKGWVFRWDLLPKD